MNTDIRISVSFMGHRKRRKLRLLLGDNSTDYLIDLWISTAMNHPTGHLKEMDEIDIALAAGWDKDPSLFVNGLLQCGFLDRLEDGTYALHDWEDHQGYAVHAEARSAKGKKAAETRWKSRNNATSIENHATSILVHAEARNDKGKKSCGDPVEIEKNATSIENHATSNAPSTNLDAPIPNPNPIPKDTVERAVGDSPPANPKPNGGSRPRSRKAVENFPDCPDWLAPEHWQAYLDHRRTQRKPLTPAAAKIVLQDLEKAQSFGHDPAELIRESIGAGWMRCVFPDRHYQPAARAPTATGAPDGRRKGQTMIEHMMESHARMDALLDAKDAENRTTHALSAETAPLEDMPYVRH